MAELTIVTLAGARSALDEAAVDGFASRLRGELLRPGDAEYEGARLLWNGVIDKRPASPCSLKDVRDSIVEELTQKNQQKALEEFIDAEKAKADIREK